MSAAPPGSPALAPAATVSAESEEPRMSAVPPASTVTAESEEPRMSAVAPVATVSAESQQPPNSTDVSLLSFHSVVKLLPVQVPVAVPLTNHGWALGTVVVLPMIRNKQSPLGVSNVMPLTRPATHSKRHELIVNVLA